MYMWTKRLTLPTESGLKTMMKLKKTIMSVKHYAPKKVQYGPRREKTCLRGFANNTGTDQPAHPHSLISALFTFWKVSYVNILQ